MWRHALFVAVLESALHHLHAVRVTLSNVALPRDQHGQEIYTGEVGVLAYNGFYYFYLNDWGGCPGTDCCPSERGCVHCCHQPTISGCGGTENGSWPFGSYHKIWVYRTKDFQVFENLGIALDLSNRPPGIIFRPHVVYNAETKKFVMWLNLSAQGYWIATADKPEGPFNVATAELVPMLGTGKPGDFHIYVDDDGSAYHVRTGLNVVKLNSSYTGMETLSSTLTTPLRAEAPVMFKRHGHYYVLSGALCCACVGGSNIFVHQADTPAGPWRYLGDIGSNPGVPFQKHVPGKYVTNAQGSALFTVPATDGTTNYIWLGNQWNSGLKLNPPGPRNHDLLYWAPLTFLEDGTLAQLQYSKEAHFEMATDAAELLF